MCMRMCTHACAVLMMIQRIVLNGGLLLIVPGEGKQLLRVLSALLICISMLMFSSLAMPFRQVQCA